MSDPGDEMWDAEDWPPGKCERCNETGIGHNDDGVWLCEDCMFEEATEENHKINESLHGFDDYGWR